MRRLLLCGTLPKELATCSISKDLYDRDRAYFVNRMRTIVLMLFLHMHPLPLYLFAFSRRHSLSSSSSRDINHDMRDAALTQKPCFFDLLQDCRGCHHEGAHLTPDPYPVFRNGVRVPRSALWAGRSDDEFAGRSTGPRSTGMDDGCMIQCQVLV